MKSILPIIVVALLAGCASEKFFEIADVSSLKIWIFKDYGFSVEFPVAWEINKLPKAVFGTSPKKGPGDLFRENVDIFIQEVSRNSDPEIFLDLAIANQRRQIPDFELTERGNAVIDEFPAAWFYGTYTLNGLKVKILQYCVCKENRLYIIVCGAAENRYAGYKNAFDTIIGSFHFLP